MQQRKDKFEAKKKLVDDLFNLIGGLRNDISANATSRSLRELKVETNDSIINVALDKNVAQPGNYQIEVLELAQKTSAMSSGFESREDSYVGVGFISYTLPDGSSKEIYVGTEDSSLDGIAKLINSDEGNGLTATVINDGSGSDEPWRLQISLEEVGDENKAEFPDFYFIDGDEDFYLEHERPAQDAKVRFNGFEVELPGNRVDSLIPGATIDLKKAVPGEEFSINISEDVQAVTVKVNDIVEKINSVLAFIKQQNTLDEKSDTSRTLGGDILLQSIESRLRGVVFTDVMTSKGPKRLGDLGIKFQRSGLIEMDPKKFENMMSSDYVTVAETLTGVFNPDGTKSPGFLDNLGKLVENSLRFPDGIVQSRKKSLQSNIDQVNRRIKDKERMIAQKEENLKAKFARLESTISQIRNQGAGLAALSAQAPNPVTQLG